MIEAFSGTLKKEKSEEMPAYPVAVSPELSGKVDQLLDTLGLQPPKLVSWRHYILPYLQIRQKGCLQMVSDH